ncbi:MAG TPA: hypothetical protein PLD19_03475, partial [Luteimonas sp.]|nr:hypothetical protein [Luteimonas sp.]
TKAWYELAAKVDPLLPRPPLETWHAADPDALAAIARRYVAGLGEFFTTRELRALDDQLRTRTGDPAGRREYTAACTLERSSRALAFRCAPASGSDGARLSGRLVLADGRVRSGVVDGLAVDASTALNGITVAPGTAVDARGVEIRLRDHDRHARLADGRAVDAIRLRWGADDDASASVAVLDDLAPLREALTALADDDTAGSPLSSDHFNRARLTSALFARLGIDGRTACCDETPAFPRIRVEPAAPPAPTTGYARAFAAFFDDCAGCHATGEHSPPNFLAGSGSEVAARMRHCAPRLYVRLAMWHRDPGEREKTPMPPPFPSATGAVRGAPESVAALERIAAGLLREETGAEPQLDALLADGYETLRPCLPDAST